MKPLKEASSPGTYVLVGLIVSTLSGCGGPLRAAMPATPRATAANVVRTPARTPTSLSDVVAPGAQPEKMAGDLKLAEGPLWLPDGRLIVSEVSANVVRAFAADGSMTTFLQPSGHANGHAYDLQGRIIQAEHDGRLSRIELDGQVTLLADKFEGKRLNSPNDAAVRSDGTIYFTDPDFGLGGRTSEVGFNGVYRLDPSSGALTALVRDLGRPNGIAFSPDEATLYVSDAADGRIRAYPVQADGSLGTGTDFGPGNDGIAIDIHGNVWSSDQQNVTVMKPDGTVLGQITSPEPVTNVAWGGADGQTLFITTFTGLYRLATLTGEAPIPPPKSVP